MTQIKIITTNKIPAEARNSADHIIGSKLLSPIDNIVDVEDFNLVIRDQLGNTLSDSNELSGIDVEKAVTIPVPEGVLFDFPEGNYYTSYELYDAGWRALNGWYNKTPTPYPKVIAELDRSIGDNYFFKLKDPLVVDGVLSTERFVDIKGRQDWGTTNNVDKITVDKKSGIGFLRNIVGSGVNWQTALANAFGYSIVADGRTFDQFFMITIEEWQKIFGFVYNPSGARFYDGLTGKRYFIGANNGIMTASTRTDSTSNLLTYVDCKYPATLAKSNTTYGTIYVFDARPLITAP